MNKYRYIRKIRLRNYLVNHGFKVEGIEPDNKYPNRFVWKFASTQKLQSAIDDYYNAFYNSSNN